MFFTTVSRFPSNTINGVLSTSVGVSLTPRRLPTDVPTHLFIVAAGLTRPKREEDGVPARDEASCLAPRVTFVFERFSSTVLFNDCITTSKHDLGTALATDGDGYGPDEASCFVHSLTFIFERLCLSASPRCDSVLPGRLFGKCWA